MSGMNMQLAAMYGTPGGPTQQDLEKEVQMQLFCKLASDNAIDLEKLTDDQISTLWSETFGKTAEEEEKKDEEEKKEPPPAEEKKEPPPFPPAAEKKEGEEEKKEAARREFEATKEAEAKLAEADYLGRAMAHAFTQELGLIAQSTEKTAAAKPAIPADSSNGLDVQLKTAAKAAPPPPAAPKFVGKKKQSSAIDDLAIRRAFEKAAAGGYDTEEATQRLTAVMVLGPRESEKTAGAADLETAVEIRSLELLEQAGYPVTWAE